MDVNAHSIDSLTQLELEKEGNQLQILASSNPKTICAGKETPMLKLIQPNKAIDMRAQNIILAQKITQEYEVNKGSYRKTVQEKAGTKKEKK